MSTFLAGSTLDSVVSERPILQLVVKSVLFYVQCFKVISLLEVIAHITVLILLFLKYLNNESSSSSGSRIVSHEPQNIKLGISHPIP